MRNSWTNSIVSMHYTTSFLQVLSFYNNLCLKCTKKEGNFVVFFIISLFWISHQNSFIISEVWIHSSMLRRKISSLTCIYMLGRETGSAFMKREFYTTEFHCNHKNWKLPHISHFLRLFSLLNVEKLRHLMKSSARDSSGQSYDPEPQQIPIGLDI